MISKLGFFTTTMEKLSQIRLNSSKSDPSKVVTVLSAIEDTIKANNAPLTPVSYFAALLALLETENVQYAGVYLLEAIISEVPDAVLCSKMDSVLAVLAPLLTLEDTATVRSATGVLESLLKAQSIESWRTVTTVQTFKSLLALGLDVRPKIRKRATQAVCSVLLSAPNSVARDSIASTVAAEELLKSATSADKRIALQSLQLIKSVAGSITWPVAFVDPLCDMLLRGVSQIGEGFITVVTFEVFEKVFEQGAKDVDLIRLQKLLKAITEFKPSEKDANVLPSWLAVIARGYEMYASAEAVDVSPVYKSVFPILQSDSDVVRKTCSACLQTLIGCLEQGKSSSAAQAIVSTTLRGINSGTRYRAARSELFNIVGALFDKLQEKSTLLTDALPILAESRHYAKDKTHIDSILGKAMAVLGPQNFFKVLPLNLEADGRAWLLPIMRDHVTHTQLAFFVNELLPLSEKFFPNSVGESNEAKVYRVVIDQIWSSLPGFCTEPTDLRASFTPEFAELLANVLYQQPDLRSVVCKALRNLCANTYMSKFALNFLLVLFNVFSQTAPEFRDSIMLTIKAFLSITTPGDLQTAFNKVLTIFSDSLAVDGAEVKHTAMDLVNAFVPHVDLDLIWAVFLAQSASTDSTMQKKAYKLLCAIAVFKPDFLQRKFPELQKALLDAKNVVQSVRKDRLSALVAVVKLLPREHLQFIPMILSEAVLCTKEQNEKARGSAFDLLVVMGERMKGGGRVQNSLLDTTMADADASVQEFFVMVQAGLSTSTPHMVSATVTALARLLFEFKDELSPEFIKEMLDDMDPILTSKNREVARSALGFYKVVLISLPVDVLSSRLEDLVTHLLGWSHEHSRDFKTKVKFMLERMVRKFGFDQIEPLVPEADKKLMANIRKTNERKARPETFDEAMDSGDEAYIQNTDEPVNLLDRSAMANVSSTRPSKAVEKLEEYPLKDGKYVIDPTEEPVQENLFLEARENSRRTAKGGVRFSNKRERDDEPEPVEERRKPNPKKFDRRSKKNSGQKGGNKRSRHN